mmetsp:Transcript_29853/g.62336  ORF Transcript_29853/g.62336 Transcript_29853/m.62336 type:complete len:94 (+) Transcript_29853:997-1278(+)
MGAPAATETVAVGVAAATGVAVIWMGVAIAMGIPVEKGIAGISFMGGNTTESDVDCEIMLSASAGIANGVAQATADGAAIETAGAPAGMATAA